MCYFWLVFVVLLLHAIHAVSVVVSYFMAEGMERALFFTAGVGGLLLNDAGRIDLQRIGVFIFYLKKKESIRGR